MSTNIEGEKPKVITTRRSSLKCRQLVNKLDPDAIMKAKPKGKRNSVSWGLSNTFEFKAMKATFQDSKDINKEDNSEQKEKHDKFLATRKASIKNESSLLKEMMKKNAASIIDEEENDDEAKANMKKNLQMGKDALKEVSESSESSKSKNSSKSGSKSGSRSSSRSNSRSYSKSSSKSGSRSSSRSKSKSYSKSSSRNKNKSGKEKNKKSVKESENENNKETEKIDIKKKRKVQMAEKAKEESDKDSQSNKENEKISIKKNRKIKIAEKKDENENDKDSEKIVLKKNRKVKVEEEEDEKGNDKDSEKINIRKNRKIKISDDINEDNFEEKKAEVIDTIKENDTKVRLISLNEANNLNLDKIAYITLTDGTVAILKKEEERNNQENPKINNKKLNLSNKPQINQNNMYEEEYNFQNNVYKDPNIPEQELYYDNDNDNDNIYNEPSGIGSAYNNNYQPQNINYYPNRPIPNINIIPDNQIPINVPYEATLSIPQRIPNNIINIPQQYYINRSQYQINSHEPYETNFSYATSLMNNRRAISPLYYTNQNRQHRQYIQNYNQQFSPSQNIRQNLSPNYKTKYQNYQKYSKNLYTSNNKYQNRNQNNLSNSSIPQIINLTQTQIPKEANKFTVKVLEVIPVKLCDNNYINRHKSNDSSQLVYPFFNTQVMDPDLSPRNQSHFQPQQRRLFNYSQTSTLNNNTNDNRVNSFEQELNILNKQMTDSFNDFDNLEEEQEDYQNDELYKNCDLKYSELSLGQGGGKLKSKNMRRQNYMRPFIKPQINKKNVASEFRYVKAKPNAYNNQNIKESKGNSLKRK